MKRGDEMGLPYRKVNFDNDVSYQVTWEDILYKPDFFTPMSHEHPEFTYEIENLIQIVDAVPSITKKGQLFLIRK